MVYNIRRTWAHRRYYRRKLDTDGVGGAPVLQTLESMHEGTYLLKVGFGH